MGSHGNRAVDRSLAEDLCESGSEVAAHEQSPTTDANSLPGAGRYDRPNNDADDGFCDASSKDTVTLFSRRFNKVLLAVHLNIVLYSTCFFAQAQVLPYLTKKIGLHPVVYGYLQTAFAIAQLIGGPLFGRFGDIYGARAAMTLAYGSGVVTYGLLSIAHSLPMLFLSRAAAVFLASMQGSQMIVTDVTSARERADALSKLGVSYGIGMVIGPFVGGLITKAFSEEAAALASCLGSLVSMMIAYTFTPKYVKKSVHAKATPNVFSFKKLIDLMSYPNMFFLLSIKILEGLPLGIFQSMFSVVAMDTFKLSPDKNGLLMSYIGILTLVMQGIGVGVLTKWYDDGPLLKVSAVVLVGAYLGLAYATDVFLLCVVVIPLSGGLTLMQMVISSALTKAVPSCDTGGVVGMNMAANSLIRSLSPLMGGYMLENWGFASFGIYGSLSSIVSAVLLLLHR